MRYQVPLPSYPPVSANRRGHWAKHASKIRAWRYATAMHVRAVGVPRCESIRVTVWVSPPDRRRRDRDNLRATLKHILDGIVDARVVVDDTPDRVVSDELVMVPPAGGWWWRMEIVDLTGGRP